MSTTSISKEKMFVAEAVVELAPKLFGHDALREALVGATYLGVMPQVAVTPQGGWKCWTSCALSVASCAGSCIPNPFNSKCVSCLGSKWDDCKDCF